MAMRLLARDEQTGDVNQVQYTEIGDYLWRKRLATPSYEDPEQIKSMSRRELVERINARHLEPGELTISVGVIAGIERGVNLHLGYFDRVMQICRGLEITVGLTALDGETLNIVKPSKKRRR